MANCPSCGAEVSPVGVFCPKCGADLQAPPRSAAASAPASDPVSGAGPVRETVRARTPGVLSLTVKGRSSRAKFWIQFAIVQGTLAALGSLVGCICAIVALRGADVTEDPALFSSLMVRTFAWSLLLLMPLDLLSGLFSLLARPGLFRLARLPLPVSGARSVHRRRLPSGPARNPGLRVRSADREPLRTAVRTLRSGGGRGGTGRRESLCALGALLAARGRACGFCRGGLAVPDGSIRKLIEV